MSLKIKILRYEDDIEPALKFRAKIMHRAFGIDPKQDGDQWDQGAYHVVATTSKKVVGYYRAIVDSEIGFYTGSEFNLAGLDLPFDQVLEIGRAAIHPEHRNPAMIPMLWGKIFDLARKLDRNWVMGAASLKPTETGVIAARDHWRKTYNYLEGSHAVPLNPYVDDDSTNGPIPKLLQVYERLGARVVSDPSWDPVFQTADVVTLIDLQEINNRWLERLL